MKSFNIFSAAPKSINETQKNIIEATFDFWFDEIFKLNREHAIKALNVILQKSVAEEDIKLLEAIKIWYVIKEIRKIIDHPVPQNRSEDYPYFGRHENPNMVVFRNSKGNYAFEERGLLGLSARNDDTASPITKKSAVEYIYSLTKKAITEVTNHVYLGAGEEVPGSLLPSTKISSDKWVVFVSKNLKDNKVSIYLEGIKPNGFFFIYQFQILQNLAGITYIKTKHIKSSEYKADQNQSECFGITNHAGERLITLVRKDSITMMNAIGISSNGFSSSLLNQFNEYAFEWVSNKLKDININVDKNQFSSLAQRLHCTIM